MFSTTMSKVSETDAADPSVAVTFAESVPTSPFSGVPENVRVVASNDSQLGRADPSARVATSVSVVPTSGSENVLEANWKLNALSSVAFLTGMMFATTGASFVLATTMS